MNSSDKVPEDPSSITNTTMVVKNIPSKMTLAMLRQRMDDFGLAATYDYLFLPRDCRTQCNLGYAIVNFITSANANRFVEHFTGLKLSSTSRKICSVSVSVTQGLEANMQMSHNSRVCRRGGEMCLFVCGKFD